MPTVGLPKGKLLAPQQHHFFLDSSRSCRASPEGEMRIFSLSYPTLLEKTLNKVTHQWAGKSRLPNHGDEDDHNINHHTQPFTFHTVFIMSSFVKCEHWITCTLRSLFFLPTFPLCGLSGGTQGSS